MGRKFIQNQLEAFVKANGRPLQIGIVNTGGTLTCLEGQNGLAPVQEKDLLEEIIANASELGELAADGLANYSVFYHRPVDSSQIKDPQRDPLIGPIAANYLKFDGFLVLHGTDTNALTARHLHLSLPYFDIFAESGLSFNADKPIILISSQEPLAVRKSKHLVPASGSDADVNLSTAVSVLVQNKVGEAGLITNGYKVLRGTSAYKASESHIPAYDKDQGVSIVGERTAFAMILTDTGYLSRQFLAVSDKVPQYIPDIGKFEHRVFTIAEQSHVKSLDTYLRISKIDSIAGDFADTMPLVALYVSKGAGNAEAEDTKVLARFMEQGGLVLRVPISGGRVPKEMHYDVPGGDIPGVNIESTTSRYKAQAVLSLLERMKVPANDRKEQFYHFMQEVRFGAEFLPTG